MSIVKNPSSPWYYTTPVCGVLYFLGIKAIDGLCSGYRNWERYGIMLGRENTRDWSLGLGLAASCYALWLRPRQKVGLFQPRKWEMSCPAMESFTAVLEIPFLFAFSKKPATPHSPVSWPPHPSISSWLLLSSTGVLNLIFPPSSSNKKKILSYPTLIQHIPLAYLDSFFF